MLPQYNRLLEMSVANVADGNGEQSKEAPKPLNDDDKKFLSEAMDSLCPDYIKILKLSIASLDTSDEKVNAAPDAKTLHAERESAFHLLLEHCDNLDVARDFEKLGGFRVLGVYIDALSSKKNDESTVKEGILALDVLSFCCQLNEYCQERAIESELLSKTEKLLDESLQSLASGKIDQNCSLNVLKVTFKAVSAISSIVRGNEASISAFLNVSDGKIMDSKAAEHSMGLLKTALGVADLPFSFKPDQDAADVALPRRIRAKSSFLLNSLVNKSESFITDSTTKTSPCDVASKLAVDVGILEKVANIIANAKENFEHIIKLLAKLVDNNAASRSRLSGSSDTQVKADVQKATARLSFWSKSAKEDGDDEMAELLSKIKL